MTQRHKFAPKGTLADGSVIRLRKSQLIAIQGRADAHLDVDNRVTFREKNAVKFNRSSTVAHVFSELHTDFCARTVRRQAKV